LITPRAGPRAGNPPRPIRPELELILCCARTTLEPDRVDRVRTLLRGGIDWGLVFQAAQPQAVVPLLWSNLNRVASHTVPPAVLHHLSAYVRTTARSNLVLAGQLLRLLPEFANHGIPAIAIKGPALAAAVYGDLTLRQFRDLDLLVHPRDVERAKKLLLSLGYHIAWFEPGCEYHFLKGEGELLVDLHERIAPRYYPMPATFDSLWRRVQPVALGGGTVPSLGPEDLLLILSVQLAKDCRTWKQRLIQLCDTFELIRAHPRLDWEFILERARRMRGERIFLLDLRLAQALLDAVLPPEVGARIQADPMVDRLATEVSARFFPEVDGPPRALRNRLEVHYVDSGFHLRVRERVRDKLDYLRLYAQLRFRRLVSPTEMDRRSISLPGALAFLYYLVRPLRIIGDWMRRRGRFSPAGR